MSFFNYEKIAYSDSRMTELFKLRYKVYCLECGYENAQDYQEKLEIDQYDPFSIHFSASESQTGRIVGTARIISASEIGFPSLNYFTVDKRLLPDISPHQIGEISRLAISKEYRRRVVDQVIYSNQKVVSFNDEKDKRDWRKRFEVELVTGLYHSIYRESLELGLTHLYAIMADGLYSLQRRWGLTWTPIGEPVDYHGLRRPYVASIAENMHWFEAEQVRQVY